MMSAWMRVLAAAVAAVYFSTNVALAYSTEKNVWTERRRHVQKSQAGAQDNVLLASLPSTSSPLALFQSLPTALKTTSALSDELAKTLPAGFAAKHADLFRALHTTHGTVRKVWLPTRNAGDRVVVHIQDVHQNEDAQRHIGGAVDSLVLAGQSDLVALEGAFAPIDVKAYHDFGDREVVGLTADCLLRKNLITGPVHTFMTTKGALPSLVGVDDKIHYVANVEAYRHSAPTVEAYKEEIADQKKDLERVKKDVFSKDLLTFDAGVGAYKEERASLAEYVAVLAPKMGVGQTGILAQALKMEKELDFNKVEQDRKELIEVLVKNLSKPQIDQLIQESAAYRTGEVRYGEFYRSLQTLCHTAKIELSQFPRMDAYIRYVMLSDRIDGEKLMDEMASVEKERYRTLAKTVEEREIVARSNKLHLTDRLLNFALTPVEWAEYETLKNTSTYERDSLVLSMDLTTFESFYREAHARDEAMARNLLSSMEKAKATQAVLVTGGFHTEGVSERLRAAGVTVVTFTPRIEKVDNAQGSAYLSIFTQEKTPLEKLFAGEKLFVSQLAAADHVVGKGGVATFLLAGLTALKGASAKTIAATLRFFGADPERFDVRVKNGVATINEWGQNARAAVKMTVQRTADGNLTFKETVTAASAVVLVAMALFPGTQMALAGLVTAGLSAMLSLPGVGLITAAPAVLTSSFPALASAVPSFVLGFPTASLSVHTMSSLANTVAVALGLTLLTALLMRGPPAQVRAGSDESPASIIQRADWKRMFVRSAVLLTVGLGLYFLLTGTAGAAPLDVAGNAPVGGDNLVTVGGFDLFLLAIPILIKLFAKNRSLVFLVLLAVFGSLPDGRNLIDSWNVQVPPQVTTQESPRASVEGVQTQGSKIPSLLLNIIGAYPFDTESKTAKKLLLNLEKNINGEGVTKEAMALYMERYLAGRHGFKVVDKSWFSTLVDKADGEKWKFDGMVSNFSEKFLNEAVKQGHLKRIMQFEVDRILRRFGTGSWETQLIREFIKGILKEDPDLPEENNSSALPAQMSPYKFALDIPSAQMASQAVVTGIPAPLARALTSVMPFPEARAEEAVVPANRPAAAPTENPAETERTRATIARVAEQESNIAQKEGGKVYVRMIVSSVVVALILYFAFVSNVGAVSLATEGMQEGFFWMEGSISLPMAIILLSFVLVVALIVMLQGKKIQDYNKLVQAILAGEKDPIPIQDLGSFVNFVQSQSASLGESDLFRAHIVLKNNIDFKAMNGALENAGFAAKLISGPYVNGDQRVFIFGRKQRNEDATVFSILKESWWENLLPTQNMGPINFLYLISKILSLIAFVVSLSLILISSSDARPLTYGESQMTGPAGLSESYKVNRPTPVGLPVSLARVLTAVMPFPEARAEESAVSAEKQQDPAYRQFNRRYTIIQKGQFFFEWIKQYQMERFVRDYLVVERHLSPVHDGWVGSFLDGNNYALSFDQFRARLANAVRQAPPGEFEEIEDRSVPSYLSTDWFAYLMNFLVGLSGIAVGRSHLKFYKRYFKLRELIKEADRLQIPHEVRRIIFKFKNKRVFIFGFDLPISLWMHHYAMHYNLRPDLSRESPLSFNWEESPESGRKFENVDLLLSQLPIMSGNNLEKQYADFFERINSMLLEGGAVCFWVPNEQMDDSSAINGLEVGDGVTIIKELLLRAGLVPIINEETSFGNVLVAIKPTDMEKKSIANILKRGNETKPDKSSPSHELSSDDNTNPSNLPFLISGGRYARSGVLLEFAGFVAMALLAASSLVVSPIVILGTFFVVYAGLHIPYEGHRTLRGAVLSYLTHLRDFAPYLALLAFDPFSAGFMVAAAVAGIYHYTVDQYRIGKMDYRILAEAADGDHAAALKLYMPQATPMTDYDGRSPGAGTLSPSDTLLRSGQKRRWVSPYAFGARSALSEFKESHPTAVVGQGSFKIFMGLLHNVLGVDPNSARTIPVQEQAITNEADLRNAVALAQKTAEFNLANPDNPTYTTFTPEGDMTAAQVTSAMENASVPQALYFVKEIQGAMTLDSYEAQFALALAHFGVAPEKMFLIMAKAPTIEDLLTQFNLASATQLPEGLRRELVLALLNALLTALDPAAVRATMDASMRVDELTKKSA